MKPKEKAKELVKKLRLYAWTSDYDYAENGAENEYYNAKKCALIAVEFAREFITGDLTEAFDKTMYLFEIKTEIQKL
jgi:hypothetical protein